MFVTCLDTSYIEMNANESESQAPAYECPVHKITHIGYKRESFEKEHFQALLNTTMKLSYQIYKQVKHGCHCPSNYAAFDSLYASAEKVGDPKE